MSKQFHYICGLPRSGSTVLTAILNQNPRFHSEITNPLFEIYYEAYKIICNNIKDNVNTTDTKKINVLNGIIQNFYSDVNKEVVFNTNRQWSSLIRVINETQPNSKFIFCVRDILSILNSFEHYINSNPLYIPSLYNDEEKNLMLSSYSRTNYMYDRIIVPVLFTIEETMSSAFKHKIILIEYDHLCSNPAETMNTLYNFLEEPYYSHDFDNLYSVNEKYDLTINSPNLHTTSKVLKASKKEVILPRDLVEKYSNREIWRDPRTKNV